MKRVFVLLLLAYIATTVIGCTKQDATIPDLLFTAPVLAEYDGKDGRPAYIAVDGLVYDVTNHKSWINGEHHGFVAGKDLSDGFNESHKATTLRKLPIMGSYAD
jgi:predicted heme/steroid binding protein